MTGDVRSAAAMAGYVDVELLIHTAAGSFARAKTLDELDAHWDKLVKPAEAQLSDKAMGILENMHSLNLAIIMRGLR
jgi:hypothetical protein